MKPLLLADNERYRTSCFANHGDRSLAACHIGHNQHGWSSGADTAGLEVSVEVDLMGIGVGEATERGSLSTESCRGALRWMVSHCVLRDKLKRL